jgi:hypothetical protein
LLGRSGRLVFFGALLGVVTTSYKSRYDDAYGYRFR